MFCLKPAHPGKEKRFSRATGAALLPAADPSRALLQQGSRLPPLMARRWESRAGTAAGSAACPAHGHPGVGSSGSASTAVPEQQHLTEATAVDVAVEEPDLSSLPLIPTRPLQPGQGNA